MFGRAAIEISSRDRLTAPHLIGEVVATAGIAPLSVPPFIVAQVVGAAAGLLLVALLTPTPRETAKLDAATGFEPA